MTNTQKIETACKPFVGKVLTSKQIIAVTLEAFPDANAGSILPSDHAGVNSKGNVYADQLFERTSTGFRVLPADEITRKPKGTRSRESMADALASAKALLSV